MDAYIFSNSFVEGLVASIDLSVYFLLKSSGLSFENCLSKASHLSLYVRLLFHGLIFLLPNIFFLTGSFETTSFILLIAISISSSLMLSSVPVPLTQPF